MASSSQQAKEPFMVSESAYYFLVMETVQTFMKRQMQSALATRERDLMYFKFEAIGFNVGRRLVEILAREQPRFADTLEVVKFICKDFWMAVFQKQIDNLRTNYRGVYVLLDSNLSWFASASDDSASVQETTRAMTPFLWFPCGLVRGALAALGVTANVVAESTGVPMCTFQIKVASNE